MGKLLFSLFFSVLLLFTTHATLKQAIYASLLKHFAYVVGLASGTFDTLSNHLSISFCV